MLLLLLLLFFLSWFVNLSVRILLNFWDIWLFYYSEFVLILEREFGFFYEYCFFFFLFCLVLLSS